MEIFDFISKNKDLFGFTIIVIGGVVSFIKWLDTRNRELKEKRFQTYMNLMGVISGNRMDSTTPKFTEMIAAIWLLLEYKEYYKMTKRILGECNFERISDPNWVKIVAPEIKKLIKEIS